MIKVVATKMWLVAVGCAVMLAACGGGDGPQAGLRTESAPAVHSALPQSVMAAAASRTPLSMAAQTISDTEFFEFAQRQWPQFFAGAWSEGQIATYHYRRYPQGDIYLGLSEGTVFVLGAITGYNLVSVAPVSAWTCAIRPGSCPTSAMDVATYLNQIREAGGFGTAAVDARVVAAAQAHANFLTTNYMRDGAFDDAALSTVVSGGYMLAHWELPALPGFTGNTSSDRLRVAGYSAAYSQEVVGSWQGTAVGQEPDMLKCVDGFVNTVYHRSGVLNPAVTNIGVGIGAASYSQYGTLGRGCVIDLAAEGSIRTMPAGWSGIYPGAGQSGLPLSMGREIPDPVPSYAVKGLPISVHTPTWYRLSVSQFTVADSAGRAVDGTVLTAAQSIYLLSSDAFFVPNGALAPNTTYTVRFTGFATGTQAGQTNFAVDRSWTFTTAAR